MTTQTDIQESTRLKIQMHSQVIVNKQLLSALEKNAKKYEDELKNSLKYEQELLRLKSDYLNFLSLSQARETSLLSQLELKDQEIGDYISQLAYIKQTTQQMIEEKKALEDQVELLRTKEFSDIGLDCRDCEVDQGTISELLKELSSIGQQWKDSGEDLWAENIQKTESLTAKVTQLQLELESQLRVSNFLDEEKEKLEDKIQQLLKVQISKEEIQEKLITTKAELEKISQTYSELNEKYKILTEKLESYKIDKDVLASKLEEVHEMLIQEKNLSQQNLSTLNNEKLNSLNLQEKINQEKFLNEKLSEQVIQDRLTISKLKDHIIKTTDIDVVLQDTLKKLDLEGSIKKTDEGYLYKNNIINLTLHSECFLVVKIAAGLIPLSDFLANTFQLPLKKTFEHKLENFSPNVADKSKSPMKSNGNTIKVSKQPLKDKNGSLNDRKKY
jgi:hypothetical protein